MADGRLIPPDAGIVDPLAAADDNGAGTVELELLEDELEVLEDDELELPALVDDGDVVSIVTDEALTANTGPVFDAPSTTEFAARRATTVPSDEQVTDTVTDDDVLDADGVNEHPVADPVFEKSPDAIPDTGLSNVNV